MGTNRLGAVLVVAAAGTLMVMGGCSAGGSSDTAESSVPPFPPNAQAQWVIHIDDPDGDLWPCRDDPAVATTSEGEAGGVPFLEITLVESASQDDSNRLMQCVADALVAGTFQVLAP